MQSGMRHAQGEQGESLPRGTCHGVCGIAWTLCLMLREPIRLSASQMLCRGHNGKVRSLAWSANDAHLVSCGTEGAVYQWKLRTFKRDRENVLKVLSHPRAPHLPCCNPCTGCL